MPAELLENPSGISCVFSDGRRYRRTVTAGPARLVRDLLEGLAGLVHPHGSIDSPGTVTSYVQGIADIIVAKHRNGPIGDVEMTFLTRYPKFANIARGDGPAVEQVSVGDEVIE